MDIGKLFGVLVVGGAMLVGCDSQEPAPPDASDVAAAGATDAAGVDGAPGEELVDCGFCPNEACCVYNDEGVGSTKEGFECCWATSC